MDLSFANPAGFWALLGLPAVVAIHFLQRRSRRQVITTFFLLEHMRRESETGHRFERWRGSVPFWLQMLMVCVLAWLLTEPRWLKAQSVQRVAVVLDAGASMQPFREKAATALAGHFAEISTAAAITEYTVMTTAPEAASLYHGTQADDAEAALRAWEPWLGAHDPTPALRVARSLAGREGIVIFVSDRPPEHELPYAAQRLLVGEPLENVGWAGVTLEEREGQPVFKAIVRNFGRTPQTRAWWLESGGQKTPAAELHLAPGQSQTIQAAFPAGTGRCVLTLAGDRFTADDRLPLVRPQPKELTVQLPAGGGLDARALQETFASFPHVRAVSSDADLMVAAYDPLSPALPAAHACLFAGDPQPGATYTTGLILAEPDPLLDGLNWQSLLVRETLGLPRTPEDRVLLWQGERPLLAERRTREGFRQLLFHFDLHTSNARKLPAFAITLHRFLESLRAEKIAPEALNVELGQKIALTHSTASGAPPLLMRQAPLPPASSAASHTQETAAPLAAEAGQESIPITQPSFLHAPFRPGFFTISQGSDAATPLLTAAARFVDPRESDFTTAASEDTLSTLSTTLVERHSEADTHWRAWLLALLAALLASWFYTRE